MQLLPNDWYAKVQMGTQYRYVPRRKGTFMYTTLSFGNPAMRCIACVKHSKQHCKNPAVTGFNFCRMLGARGGPRIHDEVDRIAMANSLHGRATGVKRLGRQEMRVKLNTAMAVGKELVIFDLNSTSGMKNMS